MHCVYNLKVILVWKYSSCTETKYLRRIDKNICMMINNYLIFFYCAANGTVAQYGGLSDDVLSLSVGYIILQNYTIIGNIPSVSQSLNLAGLHFLPQVQPRGGDGSQGGPVHCSTHQKQ